MRGDLAAMPARVWYRDIQCGVPWVAISALQVWRTAESEGIYIPSGAAMYFANTHPLGAHPWSNRSKWLGSGTVLVQRPGDYYAVWISWSQSGRLNDWYINFQSPFFSSGSGIHTTDLEIDLIIGLDWTTFTWKDVDALRRTPNTGRLTAQEAQAVARYALSTCEKLRATGPWWGSELHWAAWRPPRLLADPVTKPFEQTVPHRIDLSALAAPSDDPTASTVWNRLEQGS